MHNRKLWVVIFFFLISGSWFFGLLEPKHTRPERIENEQEAGKDRAYYEWYLSRDPRINAIPDGIRAKELEWVRSLPSGRNGTQGNMIKNNYAAVGPTQNGGRSRTVAFDIRNNSTRKIMLAGGVNGGIFRSTDGGVTWSFVHPANEVRSVTCLAQDPRPGQQDTWYAGTGESDQSASTPNAFVFGYGIFKSTDNGLTWSKLTSTVQGNEFAFTSSFHLNHRLLVHPTTGDLYVANHKSIYRSKDGGMSFSIMLQSSGSANSSQGVTDILVNKTGTRLFAAFSGQNPDRNLAGIWQSTTGDAGSWTRIAGGPKDQTDSIPGWRAYQVSPPDNSATGWGRIVLTLSANQDNLYALIENALDPDDSNSPGADLFRANVSNNPISWSANLGANITAKFNGSDVTPFDSQNGYCMDIACHPTNNTLVYIGGVSLYRSSDGFTTSNNVYYMGGNLYGEPSSTYNDDNYISHVDYHFLRFDPSNNNRMFTASDGGIVYTNDATAAKVTWENGNSQYQTFQYYHVNMDQKVGSRNFVGGSQDNGTTVRDRIGLFGQQLPDSNDHYLTTGGDGGQATIFQDVANKYYSLSAYQNQRILRLQLFDPFNLDEITPEKKSDYLFITYFYQDDDNPNTVYFPTNDSIYRTNSITSVTSKTWTLMTGIHPVVNGNIYSMASTRGNYTANNLLFIGTSAGKVYRVKDPAGSTDNPAVDITPTGMTSNSVVKDIAVNPRNHDTVMCVVSNYSVPSIFWTGNASAANPTWQIIEGNLTLPSVRSCKIVAKNTGVEYYVGTTVGLFSTNSLNANSTSWSREDGGPSGMMNTGIIQSLAYRWKDNTLLVGTHGNGMFATTIGDAVQLPNKVLEPIRNDPRFITKIYPTITKDVIQYQIGKQLGIRNVQVQVWNLGGHMLINRTSAYADGRVDVSGLPSGTYLLIITSGDGKQQHVTRFFRH